MLMVEFVSLGRDVVNRYKDTDAPAYVYQSERKASDFRHATKKEIKESIRTIGIYLLSKILSRLGLTSQIGDQ